MRSRTHFRLILKIWASRKESELTQLEKNIAETVDTLREDSEANSDNVDVREEESSENLVPEAPPLAANDDHDDDLNELLYAIQQKPKSRVFMWSLIASAFWFMLCGYYGYINVWPAVEKPVSVETLTGNLQVLIMIAVTFIPLLPLWGLAIMMRRALDMRHAAGHNDPGFSAPAATGKDFHRFNRNRWNRYSS